MSQPLAKVLGIAGAIALGAGAWPVASGPVAGTVAAVNARLAPDSISGLKGFADTLALQVDLGTTGKALGSYQVTVTWDSTVVRLDSVRSGNFGTLGQGNVNFVNGAELRLTQVNASGVTGVVTLAQLYFHVVSETPDHRTTIVPAFGELTATDFTNLLSDFASQPAVARVVPQPVPVGFTPDSLFERVGFKPHFDLVVDLSNTESPLGSYAATVTWDAAVMLLDSVSAPGSFPLPQLNPVSAGELRLTAADAVGAGGLQAVARLHFRFLGDTWPRQTPLAVSVTEMGAARTFENLLPGVVTDPAAVVIGGVLRGDIDLSGAVAALDAQVILQAVVGLSLPAGARALPNGDADCGGTLQARDAQIVLNHVVGNDVSAFCAGKIQ